MEVRSVVCGVRLYLWRSSWLVRTLLLVVFCLHVCLKIALFTNDLSRSLCASSVRTVGQDIIGGVAHVLKATLLKFCHKVAHMINMKVMNKPSAKLRAVVFHTIRRYVTT